MIEKSPGCRELAFCRYNSQRRRPEDAQAGSPHSHTVDRRLEIPLHSLLAVPGELGCIEHGSWTELPCRSEPGFAKLKTLELFQPYVINLFIEAAGFPQLKKYDSIPSPSRGPPDHLFPPLPKRRSGKKKAHQRKDKGKGTFTGVLAPLPRLPLPMAPLPTPFPLPVPPANYVDPCLPQEGQHCRNSHLFSKVILFVRPGPWMFPPTSLLNNALIGEVQASYLTKRWYIAGLLFVRAAPPAFVRGTSG